MAEDKRSLLQRFIIWREKNIKEKRFILILSFLVGIFTAFAALILKVIIHWIQNFLTDNFNATEANYLYLVYPVVGIFLTGLFVRYVVKDDISHGVTKILYAISRRQGRIKRHNTWSSIIASSITIGFGGSVGAEAPIVLTGSAIGSNLGTIFKMEHRTLMLLVGCGAAGAVAGIFKAPIAGGTDDRFDNVLLVAVADICGDGCNCFLYRDGYGCHVQIPSGPSFRIGAYSVCHYAGYLLWIGFPLFYPGHELCGRRVRKVENSI